MDLNQATQMINWLEEERRKDKAALATLQERAQGLAGELAEQARRIQEMQSALASIQASSKITQIDRLFEQFKADLFGEVDRRESVRQKADREAEGLRKVEADTLSRTIGELQKGLSRVKSLEDEMQIRRAEERRLGELLARAGQRMDDLSGRMEERSQTVSYLEEGRRQDNKRIAQLEEGGNNLMKRADTLAGKAGLLDESLQRMSSRIEEVIKRMQDQNKTFEEMRVNEFRRAQDVKGFMEEGGKMMATLSEHLASYQRMQEMALANQRALDNLQAFQARLETRQNEVSEMQRISEDRMRKQVEEWQAEEEKRWKHQTLIWSEQWQEHDRLHGSWGARLEKTEQTAADHTQQFKMALDSFEEIAKLYLSAARHVMEMQQTMVKAQPKVIVSGANHTASKAS